MQVDVVFDCRLQRVDAEEYAASELVFRQVAEEALTMLSQLVAVGVK